MATFRWTAVICMCLPAGALRAQPAPANGIRAVDTPNDTGHSIDVSWQLSPDDRAEAGPHAVRGYEIARRADTPNAAFEVLEEVRAGASAYQDKKCDPWRAYFYRVVAIGADEARSVPAVTPSPVRAVMQLFNWGRGWFALIVVTVCGAILLFVQLARMGIPLKVRKIAGLAAVEEAVGRATEMGRSILFVPGIEDLKYIATVAGITVLSRVARLAAEHDAQLEVPTRRSLVMTAARETVQASFLAAGRPDAYNADRIYYVTDEQFGFAAAVAGWMMRSKPATAFYLGTFYAESLLLAETGNAIGAIQIAGTDEPAQLPFFVAACDYTLIGEELFAASAYLSGEPQQLGSLKGQDVGKTIVGVLIAVGVTLASICAITSAPRAQRVLDYLKGTVLKAAPESSE
ncbi:MAG TPA: DUF6754 domain-containing protein [Phycisphaerae bacterium]